MNAVPWHDFTALFVLLGSTASVAVLHTLAGPDHYLPFIVMGRARQWSRRRMIFWTTFCGIGHVSSSVAIAAGAVALGHGLEKVRLIEEFRGNLAAWAMIAFGAVYFAWGVNHAIRRRKHSHGMLSKEIHSHDGDGAHDHEHAHGHVHDPDHEARKNFRLTPWVLFTIFVLGPCEPMIPLVMYPASQGRWAEMWGVSAVFTVLTIGAMLGTVLLAVKGLRMLPLHKIERFTHAIAGAVVLGAGCAIQFLGL